MYACLAVTCHLHRFWQNDRDFLRATAVTRGWNGYRNKSQHRKSTLEKKILPPFQQGFEPATFQSRVRCSNHWAIPAPQLAPMKADLYNHASIKHKTHSTDFLFSSWWSRHILTMSLLRRLSARLARERMSSSQCTSNMPRRSTCTRSDHHQPTVLCQWRWTPGQKTSLPTTGRSHPSCNITWSESANYINIPGIKTKAQDCALWIDFAYFTVPSGKFLHMKTITVI